MPDMSITREHVYNKLGQLKSPGVDLIHPRILYETREAIAYPLFLIYNKTLVWKITV